MVTTVYDPTWTDGNASGETIDGAMMESFGGYRGQDMWLSMERCIRHITGRGKILIAQFYDATEVERLRQTELPPGVPMSQWALAWCLKDPLVSAVIPGAKDPAQVTTNAGAAELLEADGPKAVTRKR